MVERSPRPFGLLLCEIFDVADMHLYAEHRCSTSLCKEFVSLKGISLG